jgi:hypothetical protein
MAIPAVLFFAERPFRLITKIVNRLDSMWVLKEGFSLYNLASFWLIVGLWAFMLMYAPQVFAGNTNPIIAFYINGHWASWLALLAVVTRFGYFDAVTGMYAGAFVYSVHEIAWITFAGVYNGIMETLYIHYAPALFVMVFLLLGCLSYNALPTHKMILVLSIVIVWDILWALAGFHTAVANWLPMPKTIYFTDPIVNIIEVLGWVIPSLVTLL